MLTRVTLANMKVEEWDLPYHFCFIMGETQLKPPKLFVVVEVLKANKCQHWYRKFRSGNFDLPNDHCSKRPTNLDDNALKALVESDPCQTIQELSDKLHSSWSTVQEHLQKIGKVNRDCIWLHHQLSANKKAQWCTICNILLTRKRSLFCIAL